jgi:CHASE2 domain-containing sensor protein
VDRTALRWHVLVWDLWFLVWGVLLGMAAWHARRGERVEPAR